jgi:deazaflavin-dependent oxidoreductase (nitroreductase family)
MNDLNSMLSSLSKEEYCYLTTTGRVTGRPHRIEIWFALRNSSVYLMAGNHRSDWVKNLLKDPHVTVRIAKYTLTGIARLVKDAEEELTARNMLADKYKEREEDGSLSEWARTALPVAIDLSNL